MNMLFATVAIALRTSVADNIVADYCTDEMMVSVYMNVDECV